MRTISRKLAQALNDINNAAPQVKVLVIDFMIRASDGNVEASVHPESILAEVDRLVGEDFKSEIIGMAALYKPQNFYQFSNYLQATGIKAYLESHEDHISIIDSKSDDSIFDNPAYASDENPIFQNKNFGTLTLEII
jgi:hypothetical protein